MTMMRYKQKRTKHFIVNFVAEYFQFEKQSNLPSTLKIEQ